jgi:probable F420-dependent oxidoreductase
MPTDALPLLGFGLPISGTWATPSIMVSIARRAEALGYASLWTFQHLLSPVEVQPAAPYRSVLDPVVSLAHVAAVTHRVRLGTAILNAPFLSPVVLAKQLSSLDHVSSGRLDAGLGLGWSVEEFTAVGVPYERRGARMEEYLRCLRAIWTDDAVTFDGEFYSVPESSVRPQPVQQPHPPVLLGGTATASLRRAGRMADGWISSSRHDLTRIGSDIRTVREAAEQSGRDPDALRFVARGLVALTDGAADRKPLHGTVEQTRDDLAHLAERGVTEVFLDLNYHPAVGSPEADPASSVPFAEDVLDTFAPLPSSSAHP